MTLADVSLLFVFVLLALSLTVITFIFRRTILSIVSAGAWIICTALGWGVDQLYDESMGLPIGTVATIFAMLALVMVFSVWFLRQPQQVEPPISHIERQRDYYKRIKEARKRWNE